MSKATAPEYFGADVTRRKDHANTTSVHYEGGTFVDSDVPRTVAERDKSGAVTLKQITVRKPAPRYLHTTTSAPNATIAELTARYKTMREGFRFAPAADKEIWEDRMNLAYHEMQMARFAEAHDKLPDNAGAEKLEYRKKIAFHRGMAADLTDKGVK